MLTETDYRRALQRQAFWEHLSPTGVRKHVEQLVAAPNSAELVQRLSPVEYTVLLKESPETRALLLTLGQPEQIRLVLDLDCWHKDTLVSTRVIEWLEDLQRSGATTFLAALDVLDSAILVLAFRRHLRIHAALPHEEDIEPLAYEEILANELYRLEFLDEESPWNERVYRLLDFLRRTDMEWYYSLMQGIMWSIDNELEEEAYRWKSGRLQDEGFTEYYEALEDFYSPGDPISRRTTETPLSLPAPPASVEETGVIPGYVWGLTPPRSLLARALAANLPATTLERLSWEMIALCNRALVMDQVDFAMAHAVRTSLQRVHAYLNLGLEHVSDGDLSQVVTALTTHSLHALSQVGIRLCLHLRQRAISLQNQLKKAPGVRRDVPGWAQQMLTGLLCPHPEFFEGLVAHGELGYHAFLHEDELQRVDTLLRRLESDSVYGLRPG